MSSDDRPEAAAAAESAQQQQQQPLEWRFAQVFGERAAGEDVQEGNNETPPPASRAPTSSFLPSRDLLGPVGLSVPSVSAPRVSGDCHQFDGPHHGQRRAAGMEAFAVIWVL
jgi:hypothetical protein